MLKPSFIDLFSGCGGLSCGLEQAGMECLLGVDFDPNAIESFKLNHRTAKTHCGDIRELTNAKILGLLDGRHVDFIVGGPPCQGFSTIGKGDPDDPKNHLFEEFARIVELLKPSGIVIENVTGLLAEKNIETLLEIFMVFQGMGYEMKAEVLSTEKYGVPEKRRRTIIIGGRKPLELNHPKPSHGDGLKTVRNVGDAFASISATATHNDPSLGHIHSQIDRKRLARIPEGCGIRYKRDEDQYLSKSLKYGIDWSSLSEGRFRQTKLQRLDRNLPSFTILTSKNVYCHPTEDRYLTPREAAAIQSFPSDFEFYGSSSSVFRQIGNAVPVSMARAIGRTLILATTKGGSI